SALFATGTRGLGMVSVTGYRRVPFPAHRMTAFMECCTCFLFVYVNRWARLDASAPAQSPQLARCSTEDGQPVIGLLALPGVTGVRQGQREFHILDCLGRIIVHVERDRAMQVNLGPVDGDVLGAREMIDRLGVLARLKGAHPAAIMRQPLAAIE